MTTDVEARQASPLRRHFTRPDVDPYDELEWESDRTAIIAGADGEPVFEQKGVEFPASWSQNATNIVASKYFRGPLSDSAAEAPHRDAPIREHSVKQLIDRIVNGIADWGRAGDYFADEEEVTTFHAELKHILVNQKACFNSPVWFNLGIEEKPQCSACFILSIDDSMDSILEWYRTEGRIFKGGSGSGINLSQLRSSKERLTAGGLASGPVSFMRGADAIAGTIKSGGKTRRAAKMVILNIDHPDIEEFIDCKSKEERKAYALGEAGYDVSLDGDAWISIQYQNANNSVRASDEFMRAVLDDQEWQTRYVTTGEPAKTYRARDLMRRIAQAAWECADPGMQYDTIINDWHTCANSGPINASNPCSEYMHLDNSACNLSSINLLKLLNEAGEF
ncbi:MAG: vitamin B12-dependent ribonucleotide reductase, partial [Chloroflexi bacterium]|nr:vitamin B12-dependent ribonucleotide reductase [Chloroflexota bacterium]